MIGLYDDRPFEAAGSREKLCKSIIMGFSMLLLQTHMFIYVQLSYHADPSGSHSAAFESNNVLELAARSDY